MFDIFILFSHISKKCPLSAELLLEAGPLCVILEYYGKQLNFHDSIVIFKKKNGTIHNYNFFIK